MVRTILVLICFFALTQKAKAVDNLVLSAAYQSVHAEGLLRSVDIALVGIANLFSQEDNHRVDDLIIHESLNRHIKRVPGMRVVLVTDEKGFLQHDSFRYPAQKIDLSKRPYLRQVKTHGPKELLIGKPFKSKFVNFSSLPISRPFFSKHNEFKGSVTALMIPDQLFKRDIMCKYCYAALYTADGTEVTTYPALASLTLPKMNDIKQQNPQNVAFTYSYKGFRMKSVWMKLPSYDLTLVYHRALDMKVETQ